MVLPGGWISAFRSGTTLARFAQCRPYWRWNRRRRFLNSRTITVSACSTTSNPCATRISKWQERTVRFRVDFHGVGWPAIALAIARERENASQAILKS